MYFVIINYQIINSGQDTVKNVDVQDFFQKLKERNKMPVDYYVITIVGVGVLAIAVALRGRMIFKGTGRDENSATSDLERNMKDFNPELRLGNKQRSDE